MPIDCRKPPAHGKPVVFFTVPCVFSCDGALPAGHEPAAMSSEGSSCAGRGTVVRLRGTASGSPFDTFTADCVKE